MFMLGVPFHRVWGLATSAKLNDQADPDLEIQLEQVSTPPGMPVAGKLLDIAVRVWAEQHHIWVSSEFMQTRY
jgi:hypothetical protein